MLRMAPQLEVESETEGSEFHHWSDAQELDNETVNESERPLPQLMSCNRASGTFIIHELFVPRKKGFLINERPYPMRFVFCRIFLLVGARENSPEAPMNLECLVDVMGSLLRVPALASYTRDALPHARTLSWAVVFMSPKG